MLRTPTVGRRRTALLLLFFVPGLELASWVSRTPAVRDLLGASTAEMGLILLGLSAGSMTGVLGSRAMIERFGTRRVIMLGAGSVLAGLPLAGLGAWLAQSTLVAAGLLLLGLGVGGSEVAINIEGADIERITGRAVLPTLHGFYSLGTVLGAAAGPLLAVAGVPVGWHLTAAAALSVPAIALAVHWLGPGSAPESRHGRPGVAGRRLWRDRRLQVIGVVILALALAEGSANDWLPLIMVDGHGLAPAVGSAVYLVFVAAMAAGRFAGGFLLARFDRAAILGGSAVVGGAGLAVVVIADHDLVAGAAVVLWGLGAALGFPVALSAAAGSGPDSTARVSVVASIGYLAFLAGPPALGLLGDRFGLRGAMVLVLSLLVVAAAVTPALRTAPEELALTR